MLNEEQLGILRHIGSSIAFDDDKKGRVTKLVIEGYVKKDGDLYELTPKGIRLVEESGAISGSTSKVGKHHDRITRVPSAAYHTGDIRSPQAGWRDVIVELTRTAPFVMLGSAFIAGAIFARRRDG